MEVTELPFEGVDRGVALGSVAANIITSPEVVELLEQVSTSAPALTKMLRRLDRLAQSGALDTLMDFAEVVQAAKVTLTDGMVARLFDTSRAGVELMDTLMSSGIAQRLPALMQATAEAQKEAAADRRSLGLWDLLAAPKRPEMQFALKFMLALAKRLPAAMQD